MTTSLLQAKDLCKSYPGLDQPIFNGVNLDILPGETVAIMGSSGSGKSSLLHLLGGLDCPTRGTVCIGGIDLFGMSEAERSRLRNREMGFVYQFHHLLPDFSALENVAMPLRIQRVPRKEAQERAAEMLAAVGLASRLPHRPAALSGGERQRVAIARAMVTQPRCLLADEPTGNLDRATGDAVLSTLLDMRAKFGTAWVLVTHDPLMAQQAERTLMLAEGMLQE